MSPARMHDQRPNTPRSEEEQERLSNDMYYQRRITTSIFCGNCGYNLKTLPVIHACPECGNEYNSRPLKMHGVFLPHTVEFPFGDIVVSALSVFFTTLIAIRAFSPVNPDIVLIALGFLALTTYLVIRLFGRLSLYIKGVRVARHIDEYED